MLKVEKGYGVLVFSYGKQYPPTNTKDIIELIQSTLPNNNQVCEKILTEWNQTSGTRLYPVRILSHLAFLEWVSYHDTKNVFHHFEQMDTNWPQNFFT